MSATSLMNKTCSIRRYFETQSAATGGIVRATMGDDSTSICAVQVSSQSNGMEGARNVGEAMYDVYVPLATSLKDGDLLYSISEMTDMVLEVVTPPTEGVGRRTYQKVFGLYKVGRKVA